MYTWPSNYTITPSKHFQFILWEHSHGGKKKRSRLHMWRSPYGWVLVRFGNTLGWPSLRRTHLYWMKQKRIQEELVNSLSSLKEAWHIRFTLIWTHQITSCRIVIVYKRTMAIADGEYGIIRAAAGFASKWALLESTSCAHFLVSTRPRKSRMTTKKLAVLANCGCRIWRGISKRFWDFVVVVVVVLSWVFWNILQKTKKGRRGCFRKSEWVSEFLPSVCHGGGEILRSCAGLLAQQQIRVEMGHRQHFQSRRRCYPSLCQCRECRWRSIHLVGRGRLT